jgi:hypothetical protein
VFFTAIPLTVMAAFTKLEMRRFSSPDGHYNCVVSRYRLQGFRPALPGHSADYSCFLSIFDGRRHCGTVPVPMAWRVDDLRWDGTSAFLAGNAEWNFSEGTCFYWSDDQTARISGL